MFVYHSDVGIFITIDSPSLFAVPVKHYQEEKEAVFGPIVHASNATPLLSTKGKLDTPVSLDHFLEDVPFYCLYDDVKCERQIEVEEQKLHQVSVTPQDQTASISSMWNSISSVSIF